MKTLYEELKRISLDEKVSFHVPGHKNSKVFKRLGLQDYEQNISLIDTTEIEGTDNLHYPCGIIKKAQEKAARIYQAQESIFLVSGSTIGVIAMIMSLGKAGDKILIARDCHQSALNALILSGLKPVYVNVLIDPIYKISTGIDIEDLKIKIEQNKDAKGLYITSPNYYGVSSRVDKISKVIKENNMVLIVDEAHGAHLNLSDSLPKESLEQGADMVVQSTHKSLPAFTQSSMLHIKDRNKINYQRLKDHLRILQSTSPSYILMSSLDMAMEIHQKNGKELMQELIQNIINLNDFVETNLQNIEIFKFNQKDLHDITKIYIITKKLKQTGYEIEEKLRTKYKIYAEFATEDGILLVSTIGNDESDFDRLKSALLEIDRESIAKLLNQKNNNLMSFEDDNKETKLGHLDNQKESNCKNQLYEEKIGDLHEVKNNITINFQNEVYLSPKEAYETDPKDKEIISLKESIGRVSAEYIIPYPPGIPILAPGELIKKEIIEYMLNGKEIGMNITGIKDQKLENIEVIKWQK